MTVIVNDRRKEYPGNAVATVFAGPRALSASHVGVWLIDDITGAAEVQTAYTLTGVGKSGTTVTMDVAPPAGKTLLILRSVPYEQGADVSNQGPYLPEFIENDALDPLAMQIQQIADKVARAIIASEITVGDAWDFDAQGRRIINLGDAINPTDALNLRSFYTYLGDFEASGLNVDPKYWQPEPDGVTTTFFIPGAEVTKAEFYDVFVNGVAIEPFDGFDVTITADTTGSTITFVVPPAAGTQVWVVLRGYAKPLTDDLLTYLLNSQAFIDLLTSIITNTLYETTAVLRLGPLRYMIPLYDVVGVAETIDGTKESYLLRATNAAATTLTIRANTGDVALDFAANPIAAPFFSVKQVGLGQVTIAGEAGITLVAPRGYLLKTRGPGSVITVTGDYVAGGLWTVSGDLAFDPDVLALGGPIEAPASAAGVLTLDLALAANFTTTLTENATLAVANLAGAGNVSAFELEITQDATGGRTLTLPATFKPLGGSDIAVAAAPGAVTLLSAKTFDNTNWRYTMQESA